MTSQSTCLVTAEAFAEIVVTEKTIGIINPVSTIIVSNRVNKLSFLTI